MAQSFLMDRTESLDRKIEEVWKKVHQMNPQLMSDWMECLSWNKASGERQSKEEIKNTVTDRKYQRNPGKNFLLRMMSCNPSLHGYRY